MVNSKEYNKEYYKKNKQKTKLNYQLNKIRTKEEYNKFIEDLEIELENIVYFTVYIYDNNNNKIETKEYNFKWELL